LLRAALKMRGCLRAIALKGAREDMKALFFSSASEGVAKMLSDNIEAMGPIRLRDIDEAQASILRTYCELVGQGRVLDVCAAPGWESEFVF